MGDFDKLYAEGDDVLTDGILGMKRSGVYEAVNYSASKCYTHTNEKLDQYFATLNLKGKRIATVGSSGDQMIYALLAGATDLTLIDVNPLTEPFVEYKLAICKNLDFDTANQIFDPAKIIEARQAGENPIEMLDPKVYRKISHDLHGAVRQFWDTIMLEISSEEKSDTTVTAIDVMHNMLHATSLGVEGYYRNKDEYERLQKVLRAGDYKLTYKIADIGDFPRRLDGRYDYIGLSNVYNYMSSLSSKRTFNSAVQKLYDKHLNPSGIIQVHYEFAKSGMNMRDLGIKFDGKTIDLVSPDEKGVATSHYLVKPSVEANNSTR